MTLARDLLASRAAQRDRLDRAGTLRIKAGRLSEMGLRPRARVYVRLAGLLERAAIAEMADPRPEGLAR